MKKITVLIFTVFLCIAGYSQNRNAEVIEALCGKHSGKQTGWYERHEVGKYYIAGIHPEYLKVPKENFSELLIEQIGHQVLTIYELCHATESTFEENLSQIKELRSQIESKMGMLETIYVGWEKQRIEIERRKNSKPKEINFKEVLL